MPQTSLALPETRQNACAGFYNARNRPFWCCPYRPEDNRGGRGPPRGERRAELQALSNSLQLASW
jgi:hypothetical protein